MKKPKIAPTMQELLHDVKKEGRLQAIFTAERSPMAGTKYPHWDKLLHYSPPGDLSHREWWLALKVSRQSLYKPVPLKDQDGHPFQYLLAEPIPERLHEIDLGAGGLIQMPEEITNPETRNRYYVGSLIKEAITSSQLEGATTTRRVAKEMIRAGRAPRDRSEQMILNNYRTMQRIGDSKDEPLTRELVFEIHRLIADETLDDPSAAGRFRRADEKIVVGDEYGEVFHEPPAADQLPDRMGAMCDFANGKTPKGFVNPVIRSIILHFWLSYDHPFVDGNGRTARALFYWSMLRHKYWLCEFISISHIILNAPTKYARAFLYTETDENDLTYFILYHLEVVRRAVNELHEYIKRKTEQLQTLQRQLRGITVLNPRQRALVGHALRHPDHVYTIQSHRVSHNVVYQTARADLLNLQERGLLHANKVGRTRHFRPAVDLEKRLSELS